MILCTSTVILPSQSKTVSIEELTCSYVGQFYASFTCVFPAGQVTESIQGSDRYPRHLASVMRYQPTTLAARTWRWVPEVNLRRRNRRYSNPLV